LYFGKRVIVTGYTDSLIQKRRLRLMVTMAAAMGAVLLWRLFYLQVVERGRYLAMASKTQLRQYQIPASRGEIYLLDGENKTPLVLNQNLKTIYANPRLVADKVKASRALAGITGDAEEGYYKLLTQDKSYVTLKTKLPAALAEKVLELKLPGVGALDQQYRVYPEGLLASQITGFVNADGEGQYGVEGFLNTDLAGRPGIVGAKTDTRGNPIATADNMVTPPQHGTSYILTIDRNIQAQAEKYLKQGVEAVGAKSGSVVIMDPATGAVKAMANWPTYNPAEYAKVSDYKLFSNPVVSSLFEPGSGFKVFTMAAGIDTGKVAANTVYDDTGSVEVDGRTIRNAENHRFGNQNMTDVIQKSLNTGMVFVLKSLGGDSEKITIAGKKLLHEYLTKRFGFGVATGIEQSGEAAGRVNPPTTQNGNNVNYANMTFGQGTSVTMLQMTAAMSAIANGGKLYQPRLIHAEIGPDYEVKTIKPKLINGQSISPTTASTLTGMLEMVVQKGSGWATRMPGYRIAGKTGTAQIPRADGKGYEEGKNIGSFIGFAPAESPRFVMMVRVDEPRTNGFAESTAVPIFGEITKWLLNYYAIAPASGGGQ
jgi:cell division protein FtsI (penicillin-binding protein 3)